MLQRGNQNAPKMPQEAPKRPQATSKRLPRVPKKPQELAKGLLRCPAIPQEASKRLPRRPRSPRRCRKKPQEPPKMHLKSIKSIPRGCLTNLFKLLVGRQVDERPNVGPLEFTAEVRDSRLKWIEGRQVEVRPLEKRTKPGHYPLQ